MASTDYDMIDVLQLIVAVLGGAGSTLLYCVWQLSAFSYRLRQVEVETAQLKARHDGDMSGLVSQLSAHRQEVIQMVVQHDEHNRQDFTKLQTGIDEVMRILVSKK